ncbi:MULTISPECIES: hypothetical protein [Halobacteriales]|uniref:Uncharacterized protein n=2 Tax=Halobacteriales TaxID=2235 RepID=A0A1I0QZE9_9EURY|nr:hypothetical protein [Natrinema salifodinae]SEW32825.1 hypothetical protein SAMN05216285_4153 [Natrinema salifodinae]
MEPEEYSEKVLFNLQDNDYEFVDSGSEIFEDVYTKTKTASWLDAGRERRFIAPTIVNDDLTVTTVREGIDELRSIGEENVRVDNITVGKGGLASMPLFPAFVTDGTINDDVKSTIEGMESVKEANIRVPVLVEVSDGSGLMGGSEVELTYPLPGRRKIARRRAVKKFVSAVFGV